MNKETRHLFFEHSKACVENKHPAYDPIDLMGRSTATPTMKIRYNSKLEQLTRRALHKSTSYCARRV